jgi:phage terminase Nu1 subunit (DNA packaging protein)
VGLHHNTVAEYLRRGMPFRREGAWSMVEVGEGIRWMLARNAEELRASKDLSDADVGRAAKVAAEAKLKELDLAERQGKLVSVERVKEEWTQNGATIREAVMGIPAVAVQSGLVAPAQEAQLEAMCRDALLAAIVKIP